jgi:pimeloyl-ACP methyl ester carboxylesterase
MARIPLALLPGTLCNHRMWKHQVEALVDVAEPIVIDTSLHDTLGSVADYVYAQVPKPFALAGLSYGGIVAFEVWRRYPDAVSHMALLDTTPYAASPEKREAQQRLVGMASLGEFREVTTDYLKDAMIYPGHRENMALRTEILLMAEEVGIDGFINQIKAQLARPDSTPDLASITCPTLVLCGEEDTLCTPEIHHELSRHIPNSLLHIISQCGHLSTMEQPEVVTSAMRKWLSV